MHKGVFVADAQAGHPPLVHVRHVAVCDVYAAPAARGRLVAVIEELQTVEVMQIPADGGVGTIDLQRVQGFVAAGVPGGFKQTERAIVEVTMEDAGVVDSDFLFLASGGVDQIVKLWACK